MAAEYGRNLVTAVGGVRDVSVTAPLPHSPYKREIKITKQENQYDSFAENYFYITHYRRRLDCCRCDTNGWLVRQHLSLLFVNWPKQAALATH